MANSKAIGVAYADQDIINSTNLMANASTGQVGYTIGVGGSIPSVTQATSKSTGVTLNAAAGQIVMNNASLANAAVVSFVLTNNQISAGDIPCIAIQSGGTAGGYSIDVTAVATGNCTITIQNISGGALAEAIVMGFALLQVAAV